MSDSLGYLFDCKSDILFPKLQGPKIKNLSSDLESDKDWQ